MANVSRVNGFVPVRNLNGAPANLALTTYYVPASDATALYVGDCVKIAGTADANGRRGVTKAAVGDAICGTVVEVYPNFANLNTPQYRAASVAQYVWVADDPNTIFEVQISGTIATTDVGLNANFADAGGNTQTGISGETLDGTTKATTATLTFKILDFDVTPDNDPTLANAKVYVKINNHQLASGTGTLGVA